MCSMVKNDEEAVDASILTVNTLLKILTRISENGGGDLKVKCSDAFLHEDEIGIAYTCGELRLRGYLFNQPIFEKIEALKKDIEIATRKFYG